MWLDGVITDVLGPVTYLVSVNGTCVKRHVNQMLDAKRKSVTPEQTLTDTEGVWDYPIDPGVEIKDTETVTVVCEQTPEDHPSSVETDRVLNDSSRSGCVERPKRNLHPPQHLDL